MKISDSNPEQARERSESTHAENAVANVHLDAYPHLLILTQALLNSLDLAFNMGEVYAHFH